MRISTVTTLYTIFAHNSPVLHAQYGVLDAVQKSSGKGLEKSYQEGMNEETKLRNLRKGRKKNKKAKSGKSADKRADSNRSKSGKEKSGKEKSGKAKSGKAKSGTQKTREDCLIEKVEEIYVNGETKEKIYYVLDEECIEAPTCEEKSSDVQECKENDSGECLCKLTCLGQNTLSSKCITLLNGECLCTEPWIVTFFMKGDRNKDENVSQEEVYQFYNKQECEETFIYDGVTITGCTTQGWSDEEEKFPWCSTKVDDENKHILAYWKHCTKEGFDNEWENAKYFDRNNDGMLNIHEIIAFEDEVYGNEDNASLRQLNTGAFGSVRTTLNSGFIINLSKDFPEHRLFDRFRPGSDGAQKVKEMFDIYNDRSNNDFMSVMVIEDGQLVAEEYNTSQNINRETTFYQWSATKTVMTIIVGMMIKEFNVPLSRTLLQFLPAEVGENCGGWGGRRDCFQHQREKQSITLESLLKMTSGMHDLNSERINDNTSSLGGEDLDAALDDTYYKEWFLNPSLVDWYGQCASFWDGKCGNEDWHYVYANNILSYVIESVVNQHVQNYAADKFFPRLGIDAPDYGWCTNEDGVGHSYHGMILSTVQMAKIGQFMLQDGRTSIDQEESDLVSKSFMDNIFSVNTRKYIRDQPDRNFDVNDPTCWDGNFNCGNQDYTFPHYSYFVHKDPYFDANCAVGTGGKFICWNHTNKRVVVINRTVADHKTYPEGCNFNLPSRFLFSDTDNSEAMQMAQYLMYDGGHFDFNKAAL